MRPMIGLVALVFICGLPRVGMAAGAAEPDGVWPAYAIELPGVPFDAPEPALAQLQRLREKGYLAYAYRRDSDGVSWMSLAIGAFHDLDAATDFHRAFTETEGLSASIIAAPARIVPGQGGGEFVVTPTALWVRDDAGVREVYRFEAEGPYWRYLPRVILAKLSPDGRSLAFLYAGRVHVASLDSADTIALNDSQSPRVAVGLDYPWQPGWSPSGRHVVFLDRAEWYQPGGLWMASGDGEDLRCLSCDPTGMAAVRWFLWHPTEERLFFLRTARRTAIGGELLSVGADGVIQPVAAVPLADREEIVGPLAIEDGHLAFKRLRWVDEHHSQHTVTDERVPLDAL